MTDSSQSPVSPITPNSPTPHPANVTLTQAPITPPFKSSNGQNGSWLPFTFRWYFLLLPLVLSLTFGIVIIILIWYSQKNHGLGADDGSSAILFGWRFTPTLLAVLYTQLTVIIFDDAKRTEPFARLAKGPAEGASAHGTVLQTPRAWWSIFMDALFKRKVVGKTSWCLICSAFINVLALLAISPLSSALLSSEEVLISEVSSFTRVVPRDGIELPIVANRETYFRTMAVLMRNVSTSAWITDSSLTLPFWPSSEELQLGPDFLATPGTWKTNTTTLYTSLGCEAMTLESADLRSERYSGAYDVMGKGPYNGTQPMVTFVLASDDGCRYSLSLHPTVDLAYNGGLTWSNTSNLNLIWGASLQIGNIPFVANITSTSPYARFNSSEQCRDRDIIILATPWTKPVQSLRPGTGLLTANQTYERSSKFQMKGLLCESNFTMDNHAVTATISGTKQTFVTNLSNSSSNRVAISHSLVDIPAFQALALQDKWRKYFNKIAMSKDAQSRLNGYLQSSADASKILAIPSFSGLGPLLGALYSFNMSAMLNDTELAAQAARVKGRFFTESLREALTISEAVQSETINGETTVIQERVVVLTEIGITLAVLLLVSFLLLTVVYWSSRLSQRPLNLRTDPSSTVGLSMLLSPQVTSTSVFKHMNRAPSSSFHSVLRTETFYTLNGSLHESNSMHQSSTAAGNTNKKSTRNWRPLVLRLRMLSVLGIFLILVLVAVLTLSAFSAKSRLSQLAFIYEADVSKLGLSFSTFAPISIAPTLVSIIIALWWDQLDMTFRILQPYISMSRQPTPIARGAGLTYRSKTWIGAAVKAARNRHFVLFTIAIGSVLCQILTVSMSALFERRADNVEQQMNLNTTLTMRRGPVITEIEAASADVDTRPLRHVWNVLDELYLDPPKNWLAGAAIQISLNGSQLPWTYNDWSFVPYDFSNVSSPTSNNNIEGVILHSSNITVKTSGIRARLECSPIEDIANISSWLAHPDEDKFDGTFNFEGFEDLGPKDFYWLNRTMFDHTSSNTSVFANTNEIQCCSNGTNNDPQTAAIGYWSPTDTQDFPHVDKQWPISFVTKWIAGKPIRLYEDNYDPTVTDRPWENLLLFLEAPSLQAANCEPIIEVAEAKVTVDKTTAVVLSYELDGPVKSSNEAWSEIFTIHDLSKSTQHYDANYTGPLNITTSYGILFMDSMFKAADPTIDSVLHTTSETASDNAFVMRDQEHGLNMDLMTYSMYALAGKNPEALLDYDILVSHANRTFQTFFQHFINNGLSITEGGLTYQNIKDESYEGLGRPVDIKGTALAPRTYPVVDTNDTIQASMSNRIQVLHMNPVATYLSTAILIWLIGTTAVMMCLQRRYTRSMIRDVQLIADVLVLVAGSDNFLEMIHDKGMSLKKNKDIRTMLGWFKGVDGEVRWGVEVVGGRNAVEWVKAPT
ncbi:Nn.00g021860.m01.CDS01 [Neocucurbitaria sp. VM-36]